MTVTAGLLVISTAVGFFLTALLVFSRTEASRILAMFTLLLTGISLLQLTVALKSELMLYLPFVVFPAIFLHGTIIESYTRSMLGVARRVKQGLILCGLPPVVAFVAQLTVFVLYAEFRHVETVYQQQGAVMVYTSTLFIAAIFYNLIFILSSARMLPQVASPQGSRGPRAFMGRITWLKLFLLFNAVLCVGGMLNVFYNLLADEPAPVNPLTAVLFSGGNYLILTFLIIKPAVFSVSADFAPAAQKGKYAKIQNIDAVNRKRYAQQIRDILAGSEAYLDDSYSLNDLAEQLKLSPHLVSMIINAELQQNFYNLVNSYRVEKAKQLLMSAAEPNMIEVAYASGFQSKSAFNRVFKQITGQTPSTFRVS